MSEYIFGTTRTPVNAAVARKIDAIRIEEGGHGYTSFREPGNPTRGWFTGPNLGFPFDRALSARVMARVRAEFPAVARLAWPE
jgi:hypothetical protein